MTDEPPPSPPPPVAGEVSPEELARLLTASGMPGVGPVEPPSRSSMQRKLIIAVLVAAVGAGASVMSCVGQSFSYRQAHALEGIEQQLREMRASCAKGDLR